MTTNFNTFNPTPVADTASGSGSLTGNQSLGKEEFLRMLVTQLSNQDPLNPMDGQEFAAQLAQFTSVEQLINIGDTLSNGTQANNALARSLNNSIATGLIGKTVEVTGDTIAWDGGEMVGTAFELPSAASQVEVTVRDADGNVVRTMALDAQSAGKHAFSWDGRTDTGATAPHGTYTFEVTGTDTQGEDFAATTFVSGEVDRITLGPDGTQLWIGDLALSMANVRSIAGA